MRKIMFNFFFFFSAFVLHTLINHWQQDQEQDEVSLFWFHVCFIAIQSATKLSALQTSAVIARPDMITNPKQVTPRCRTLLGPP